MSQSKEWAEKQTIYKTENDAEDFQCEEFSLGLMEPMVEEDWVMGSYISQWKPSRWQEMDLKRFLMSSSPPLWHYHRSEGHQRPRLVLNAAYVNLKHRVVERNVEDIYKWQVSTWCGCRGRWLSWLAEEIKLWGNWGDSSTVMDSLLLLGSYLVTYNLLKT